MDEVSSRLQRAKLKISLLPPGPRKILVEGICLPLVTTALPIIWNSLTNANKDALQSELDDMSRVITGAIATAKGLDCRLEAGVHDIAYYLEKEAITLTRRTWMLPPAFDSLSVSTLVSKPKCFKLYEADCPYLKQSPRHLVQRQPTTTQRAQWPPLAELPPALIGLAVTRTKFLTTLPQGFKKEKAGNEACHAFNLTQLEGSYDIDLWTDGSVQIDDDGVARTGGGWMIFVGERLIAKGTLSLGSPGCSYSLEREAIREGLNAVVKLVTSGAFTRPPRSIRIVSDSLSTLQELQAGPHRQCEEACECVWTSVALLLPAKTAFVFTFSHVQPEGASSRHKDIDTLANDALSQSATTNEWP